MSSGPTTPQDQVAGGSQDTEDWEEEAPHSTVCTKFNHLSPRQTGYIDKPELRAALDTIFKKHGSLEYGITTRAERWAFWAPRELKWAELKKYFPDVD